MIPKKIHYCWLGDDEMPPKIKKCISSWQKYLPDYELILWNKQKFDVNSIPWVKEAYEAKKYAFAADYIRCYALFHEGGIYLDSDVEVLKSFNDLLHLPYFMGKETHNSIEAAVMGTEKGNPLFKEMLTYYHDRHFNENGVFDTTTMPNLLEKKINDCFSINEISSLSQFHGDPKILNIFPSDWFSPKSYATGEINKTDNTYSIHHFEGSWFTKKQKRKLKIIKIKTSIKTKFPAMYRCLQTLKHVLKGDRFRSVNN